MLQKAGWCLWDPFRLLLDPFGPFGWIVCFPKIKALRRESFGEGDQACREIGKRRLGFVGTCLFVCFLAKPKAHKTGSNLTKRRKIPQNPNQNKDNKRNQSKNHEKVTLEYLLHSIKKVAKEKISPIATAFLQSLHPILHLSGLHTVSRCGQVCRAARDAAKKADVWEAHVLRSWAVRRAGVLVGTWGMMLGEFFHCFIMFYWFWKSRADVLFFVLTKQAEPSKSFRFFAWKGLGAGPAHLGCANQVTIKPKDIRSRFSQRRVY